MTKCYYDTSKFTTVYEEKHRGLVTLKNIEFPDEFNEIYISTDHYRLPFVPSFVTTKNKPLVVGENKISEGSFLRFCCDLQTKPEYRWFKIILHSLYMNTTSKKLCELMAIEHIKVLEQAGESISPSEKELRIVQFEEYVDAFINVVFRIPQIKRYYKLLHYFMDKEKDMFLSSISISFIAKRFSDCDSLPAQDVNALFKAMDAKRKLSANDILEETQVSVDEAVEGAIDNQEDA